METKGQESSGGKWVKWEGIEGIVEGRIGKRGDNLGNGEEFKFGVCTQTV